MRPNLNPKNSLLWGVVAVVIGLLVMYNAGRIIDIAIQLIGILFVVIGVVELISFLKVKTQKNLAWGVSTFGAIVALIFGIVLLSKPELLRAFAMIIVGILVIMLGVWQVIALTNRKKRGANVPVFYYIFAVLLALSGVTMFFFPLESSDWIVSFAGAWIVAFGLIEIISFIFIKVPDNHLE